MRTLIAIVALLFAQHAAAQMFKCVDKAKKITYSSTKCSDIGLKDAGEIRDLLQVTPAPANVPPVQKPASPPVSGPVVQPEASKPAAAAEEGPDPKRRCFTITLANGKTAVRCNDKPDGAE